MTEPLKVGLITDWARAARGQCWTELLARLNHAAGYPNEVSLFPLADIVVSPAGHDDLAIRNVDVLIVNADAANGDPDFGAHLALRWFEHRAPELLNWVRAGNVLLLESQTVFGSPCQDAYDALVGSGELPASGPEDPANPQRSRDRIGALCRKAKNYPKKVEFESVPAQIRANTAVTKERLFPDRAGQLISGSVTVGAGDLYRGWFRRTLRRRRLQWVSIVETADRGWLRNHSTLQVAALGKGAVFASTMLLSASGQDQLVTAILGCARGNNADLPAPTSAVQWVQDRWEWALGITAGAAAGWLGGNAWVVQHLPKSGTGRELSKELMQAGFVAGGILLFEGARRALGWVRARVVDFVGY